MRIKNIKNPLLIYQIVKSFKTFLQNINNELCHKTIMFSIKKIGTGCTLVQKISSELIGFF